MYYSHDLYTYTTDLCTHIIICHICINYTEDGTIFSYIQYAWEALTFHVCSNKRVNMYIFL